MKRLRIGCGAGFWGDSALGPEQLVLHGEIDFLVLDYLAEITMSLLARMRRKRPELGFATDFVEHVMAPLASEIARRNIRVVTNAGGVNPEGCRVALEAALAKAGVTRKIAIVTGDDVRGLFAEEAPLSANAYLGAAPIAEALRQGADIVITGRCVDSALALGPLLATFDWKLDDHDRLATGSLAGHVIECGAQGTGGLFTDWREVERGYSNMGFPIAECSEDGSFVVGKPPATGGLVSPSTISEQIVYEVHDPARYLLPDVTCDFTNVTLEQVGPDLVRVTGARGAAPTDHYKASLTFEDGYRVGTTLLIVGHEASAKAARVGEAILDRVERVLEEKGLGKFRERSVEVFGAEGSFGKAARVQAREVVLKIAASHAKEAALELLAREIAPSATSMVASISGFAGGRPRVQPIVRLASALVPKTAVQATVLVGSERSEIAVPPGVASSTVTPRPGLDAALAGGPTTLLPLRLLAHGRSGDKGDTANIGVIARDPAYLPVLRSQLTADFVARFFAHFVKGPVTRYEWPGLHALNFVLEQALGGGGIASLRHDPQGKGFSQLLLEAEIEVPTELALGIAAR